MLSPTTGHLTFFIHKCRSLKKTYDNMQNALIREAIESGASKVGEYNEMTHAIIDSGNMLQNSKCMEINYTF